jgi:hypothetical protein
MRFIVETLMTEEKLSKYYSTCVYKKYKLFGAVCLILGGATILAYFTGLLGRLMASGSDPKRVIILLIAGISLIFIALLEFMYPKLTAKSVLRKIKKRNGGEIPKTQLRFKDKIYQFEGNMRQPVLSYRYDDITEIVETEEYYYLLISKYVGIIVDKNGFIKGEEAEFMDFINKKVRAHMEEMLKL